MSVETVKARLATICETYVTGLVSAHTTVPRNLTAADFPAIVVLTGEATQEWLGKDLGRELRIYRLALLAKSWATGVEGEAEEICAPFFARVRDVFWHRPGLHTADNTDPLANVMDVRLLGDTGVADIELAAVTYAGVMFNLQVEEYFEITQGA